MTEHPDLHPDLVLLLRGELSNAETVAAGDHLAACTLCQEELADAVVGHALLGRAGRTLGTPSEPRLAPPGPPRTAALSGGGGGGGARGRRTLLAAVAAVVLLAGGVGVGAWWADRESTVPTRPTARPAVQAALDPVAPDEPVHGEVSMVGDDGVMRLTVEVADLPRAASGEYYYAWLLDPTTNKMLALGLVDADRGASFDIDESLVAQYSAVDVSLEADDGDPGHSVTSVLRGSYTPPQYTTAERTEG